MMKIYFLTHTSTQIQDGTPIEDWPLSDKGRLQAQEIATKMLHLGITKIVSSYEKKATQTAEIIAKELGLSSSQISGLQEVHREISTILPFDEFMKICIDYLDGVVPLGWEDREVAQTRLMEALRKFVSCRGLAVINI